MKKLIYFLMMFGLLLMVAFGAYYAMFKYQNIQERNYSRKYNAPDYEAYDYLTTRQTMNLGWAQKKDDHPESSYLNFPTKKAPGVYRIGVFGGSFTEGSETCNGGDFPSQLHKILNEYRDDSIEVINFGVSGYGMHQSYLLYQYVGRNYDLDEVIFNPYTMHLDRDNSFRLYFLYEPLHARYILDGDSLKLIEIPGDNRAEAVEVYHSFFQPQQYVQYDRRVPNYLKPILGNGENPSYYLKDAYDRAAEIGETYKLIFNKINEEVKLTVTAHNYDLAWLKTAKYHVDFAGYEGAEDILIPDFYNAPNKHPSYLLNKRIAHDLAEIWVDSLTEDYFFAPYTWYADTLKSNNLQVIIGGKQLGAFYSKKDDPYYSTEVQLTDENYLQVEILGEFSFLPLNFKIENESEVILRINGESEEPFGRIFEFRKGLWFIHRNAVLTDTVTRTWQGPRFYGTFNDSTNRDLNKLELIIAGNAIPLIKQDDYLGESISSFSIDSSSVYYFRLKCDERLEEYCPLFTNEYGVTFHRCDVQFSYK